MGSTADVVWERDGTGAVAEVVGEGGSVVASWLRRKLEVSIPGDHYGRSLARLGLRPVLLLQRLPELKNPF